MAKTSLLDYKILSELLRNSKVSDRQIAKKLRVSQPTVTRRRSKLEKTLIEGYTVVPSMKGLGFEIIALTFMTSRREALTRGRLEVAQSKARKWHAKHPNVIFVGGGEGMGWNGVMVSLHKSFSAYAKFKAEHNEEFGEYIAGTDSFIMEVNSDTALKPFNLNYLADLGEPATEKS